MKSKTNVRVGSRRILLSFIYLSLNDMYENEKRIKKEMFTQHEIVP